MIRCSQGGIGSNLDRKDGGKMYDWGLMTLSDMSVVTKNPQEAFEDAIRQGVLTEQTAENYMYMYSTTECDWFKNIITREYIKSAA